MDLTASCLPHSGAERTLFNLAGLFEVGPASAQTGPATLAILALVPAHWQHPVQEPIASAAVNAVQLTGAARAAPLCEAGHRCEPPANSPQRKDNGNPKEEDADKIRICPLPDQPD